MPHNCDFSESTCQLPTYGKELERNRKNVAIQSTKSPLGITFDHFIVTGSPNISIWGTFWSQRHRKFEIQQYKFDKDKIKTTKTVMTHSDSHSSSFCTGPNRGDLGKGPTRPCLSPALGNSFFQGLPTSKLLTNIDKIFARR